MEPEDDAVVLLAARQRNARSACAAIADSPYVPNYLHSDPAGTEEMASSATQACRYSNYPIPECCTRPKGHVGDHVYQYGDWGRPNGRENYRRKTL